MKGSRLGIGKTTSESGISILIRDSLLTNVYDTEIPFFEDWIGEHHASHHDGHCLVYSLPVIHTIESECCNIKCIAFKMDLPFFPSSRDVMTGSSLLPLGSNVALLPCHRVRGASTSALDSEYQTHYTLSVMSLRCLNHRLKNLSWCWKARSRRMHLSFRCPGILVSIGQ